MNDLLTGLDKPPVEDSAAVSAMPPIDEMSSDEFRQTLAGLRDRRETPSGRTRDELREMAIEFVAALPNVFGDGLDRLTLWERIGTALETACARHSPEEIGAWIEEVRRHILADVSRWAACEPLADITIYLCDEGTATEDRHEFVGFIRRHLVAVVTTAKSRWKQSLEIRKATKQKGGAA